MKFLGSGSFRLNFPGLDGTTTEADDVSLRFRTTEQAGLLLLTQHDRSNDRLRLAMEGGRVRLDITLGSTEKTVYVGQSLNDDIYHTLVMKRRGNKIEAIMDDDDPIIGEFSVNFI